MQCKNDCKHWRVCILPWVNDATCDQFEVGEATKPGPLGSAVLPGWDARLSKAIEVVFDKMADMTPTELANFISGHATAKPERAEAIRRAMVIDN